MNTKSCWSFLPMRESRARLWLIVPLSILIVGFAIRFVEVTNDTFGFDEYACMMDVEKSLPSYVNGRAGCYGISLLVHYWLSHRLLGSSLIDYRTMSLIAGILLLIIVTFCLMRFFPSDKGICIVVLCVLIFNSNLLYLSRYSMFAYGNTLLVSVAMFFLFMRLAEGPIEKKMWLWMSFIILIPAFFSSIVLMVPLATGVFSVIVFRWWRFNDSRNLAALCRCLWELKPLLIFPLTYLIINIMFPITNLGADKRPDMAPLFFTTSNFSQDILGVMKFTLTRTFSLFWGMLGIIVKNSFITKAMMIIYFLLAGLAVLQAVRGKVDQRINFTIFFLLITLVAIIGASVMGFYPYGRVRYTPYLILPTIILIGFGGSLVFRWISDRFLLTPFLQVIMVCLLLVVLIFGGYITVNRYNSFSITNKENDCAIEWIRFHDADLILSDAYIIPILSAKAPEIYERTRSMGWGTYWGKDVVPHEFVDVITKAEKVHQVNSILVILHYKDIAKTFPNWSTLLNSYFDLDAWIESPGIGVKLYRRRH